MTGTIADIHVTEPIGTIRVAIRRGPKGELIQVRDMLVDLMWPPVDRTDAYRHDCGCREVYAVSDGAEIRAAFGLPKTNDQRFVCACFFVEVPR